LLAEYGIIGVFAAMIFLETHLRRGWSSFTGRISRGADFQGMSSNSLALTIGSLSAAAACLMHSLLDYNLHMPANLLTAALIFGMLASPGERPEASASEEEPGFPPFLRLALPALGILIAVRIAPTAPAEYYAYRTSSILSDWHRSASVEPNQEMEALARRGLAWDPHNPELLFALAEAQAAQGDFAAAPQEKERLYTEAVESYRRTLEYAPGDVHFVLALAMTLDSLRRFSESDPHFARALSMDPSGGITHNLVGHHFLKQGKYAEAKAQFRQGMQFGALEAGQSGLDQVEEAQRGGSTPPAPLDAK
jgi:tetratricopeptide (TPR) repeat protein